MATVNLQGSAPGGAFTLGTSGLSTLPLNGTRCWNTATSSQSCLLTIVSTPCVSNFECMETGVAYGAHIGGFVAGAALAKPFTVGRARGQARP